MSTNINSSVIRQSLETALSIAVAPTRVAFEAIKFKAKSPTEIYVESFILSANSYNPSMGDDFHQVKVILQANVVGPAGIGSGAVSAMVDRILAYFKIGLTLVNDAGGRIMVISSPSVGPMLVHDPLIKIPVSVTFLCDINKE